MLTEYQIGWKQNMYKYFVWFNLSLQNVIILVLHFTTWNLFDQKSSGLQEWAIHCILMNNKKPIFQTYIIPHKLHYSFTHANKFISQLPKK